MGTPCPEICSAVIAHLGLDVTPAWFARLVCTGNGRRPGSPLQRALDRFGAAVAIGVEH